MFFIKQNIDVFVREQKRKNHTISLYEGYVHCNWNQWMNIAVICQSVLSVCTWLLNSWFHFSSASAQLHTWHIIIYSVLQQLELKISTHLVTHGLHLGTILKYVISAWGGNLCPDITCSIQFSSGPLTLAHLLDMQKCTQRGPLTQIDQHITSLFSSESQSLYSSLSHYLHCLLLWYFWKSYLVWLMSLEQGYLNNYIHRCQHCY